MNSIILKYLISNFFRIIFNMILIFMSLGVILTLFEEIEFFKNLEVSLAMPFKLTLLFIPNLVFSKLFPFIIFASSMWYLISIKNNKDIFKFEDYFYIIDFCIYIRINGNFCNKSNYFIYDKIL